MGRVNTYVPISVTVLSYGQGRKKTAFRLLGFWSSTRASEDSLQGWFRTRGQFGLSGTETSPGTVGGFTQLPVSLDLVCCGHTWPSGHSKEVTL